MSRRTLASAAVAALATAAGLTLVAPAASAAPDRASRAEQAVRATPSQVALDDRDVLTVRDQFTDADGTDHVRFDRERSGLPVLGGDMVVNIAPNGSLRGVSATTRQRLTLSLTPRVSKTEAMRTAESAAGNGATVVHDGVLDIDARTSSPRLAWAVVVEGTQKDGTPSELMVLVDARTGEVVARHE